jgi:cytoskeleton protein RodZ
VSLAAKPAAKAAPKPEAKTEANAEVTRRSEPVKTGGAIAAEPGARVTVRMIFEQASWVEIKDRNGNAVFGQLNPAGSRRSASGEPPLSIVVGNAAGVRLFRGEKAIDLAPHTRVDVARLTLE